MGEKFFEVRDLIGRLYEWFRTTKSSYHHNLTMANLLAENCETTLLRLFGPKALENLKMVFMDTGAMEDQFASHDVQYTAQTAF